LEQPDCVLSYTVKPVIWSSIVLRFFPKIRFIGMITGLGYAFGGQGRSRSLVSTIVKFLYKLSLANAYAVIFQNPDNKATFIELGLVDPRKASVVNGSGVNLEYFSYQLYNANEDHVSFLMIARFCSLHFGSLELGVTNVFYDEGIVNIPSTIFLRSYDNKIMTFIRVRRIKKVLQYANNNNKLVHLWWHPHNFGINIEQNINMLAKVLEYANKIGIESLNMREMGQAFNK
jgi:hypothetical protein